MRTVFRRNFIERSVMGALSFLKESVFSDECASRAGFLQSIDPRFKAASFAFFLLAVLFARSFGALAALYLLSLVLAKVSRVGAWPFVKRTWIFIPLFSFFIAFPALFGIVTPGEPLFTLGPSAWNLAVTRQGVHAAALFIMRVATSVSFAVLLSITTKHFELLKTVRLFGVPQVFVMVFGMCYRYIYLFAEMIEETFRAIRSRVGTVVRSKTGRKIAVWNMASLWHRSLVMSETVYDAMLSRGYTGEPVITRELKAKPGDWVWLFAAGAVSLWILWAMRS